MDSFLMFVQCEEFEYDETDWSEVYEEEYKC